MTTELPQPTRRTKRSTIRRSSRDDVQAVHAWLVDEEERGVHGNFLCNWQVVESAHRDDKLLVYVDGVSSLPVGFQLGGLIQPGILQVRNEYRRRGIGRKLVERCITLAYKRDHCLLYIECKPSSSIPFWERMGFNLLENNAGGNYAYRILHKQHALPEVGSDIKVVIRFYANGRQWDETTPPYITATPAAKLTPNGTVYLAERVLFHEGVYPTARDMVVEIEVAGERLFLDKAKYERAQQLGVIQCRNGFYIDRIQIAHTER